MDLAIIETGGGGDLIQKNNDIEAVTGFENIPYLAMFGGSDWWGNEFLDESQQFNSQTEAALNNNPLSGAGRLEIEKAIKADLAPIAENVPGTTITVSTQITNDSRLAITITVNGKEFNYNWNPSSKFLTYNV